MNSRNDTGRTSRNGGGNISLTPSTALLNRRLGTSHAPRELTPYEVDLLRRSKAEMARVAHEVLASRSDTSQT